MGGSGYCPHDPDHPRRSLGAVRVARPFAVLCLLAAINGCDSTSAGRSDRTARLPDGFHAPEGTTRVGPVMPELVRGVTVARHRAWTAILKVHGEARGVYDALARQANHAGFAGVASASDACASEPDVDVGASGPAGNGLRVLTCSAESPIPAVAKASGSRHLELVVASCRDCRPEIKFVLIHYDAGSSSEPPSEIVQGPVPTRDPSIPGYPEWTRFSGTRVLMNERYAGKGCEVSQVVALAVDDASRTWRSVLHQLPGVRIVASTTRGGRRFRQAIAADGPSYERISLADAYRGEPAVFTMLHCEG